MDIVSIGNYLRSIRLKLGFSQEQAAEICDICDKTYGKLERGQTNVTHNVLNKVAGGLGLSLVDIILGVIPNKSGDWEYFAVLEPCRVQDTIIKFTYGIIVCKNMPTGRYIITTVHDVSINPRLVSDIVDSLNSYMLSPIHLMDVLYDVLP